MKHAQIMKSPTKTAQDALDPYAQQDQSLNKTEHVRYVVITLDQRISLPANFIHVKTIPNQLIDLDNAMRVTEKDTRDTSDYTLRLSQNTEHWSRSAD